LSEGLARYEVNEAEGRNLISLLGINPIIDESATPPRYRTDKSIGYYFQGKVFDSHGGTFHIEIRQKQPGEDIYWLTLLHYDPPSHYTRFIPAADVENNGNLAEMKGKIKQAISAIRDKNSDIIITSILKRKNKK